MQERRKHGNNYIRVADIVSPFIIICNVKRYSGAKRRIIYFFQWPAEDSHRQLVNFQFSSLALCQQDNQLKQ